MLWLSWSKSIVTQRKSRLLTSSENMLAKGEILYDIIQIASNKNLLNTLTISIKASNELSWY